MKIMIDTNVILDILFAREPFLSDSIAVLHMCEEGFAEAVVSAKTIADIYYFLKKALKSDAKARMVIRKLMCSITVCEINAHQLEEALDVENNDYEDAAIAACAKAEKCSYIISRNKKHFRKAGIPCLTPEEFVQ